MKIKENAEPTPEIIAHYKRLGLSESDSEKAAQLEARLAAAFRGMGLTKDESFLAARGPNDSRNHDSSSAFGAGLEDLMDVER